MSTKQFFTSSIATGCGSTTISLSFQSDEHTELLLKAAWMGQVYPLDITFECTHKPQGNHYGTLRIMKARDCRTMETIALPPSEADLIIEYVRLPLKQCQCIGTTMEPAVESWTSPFDLLLWLQPDIHFDDGTDLAPEDYEVPPELFAATVSALEWLERPWKLDYSSNV